MIGILHKKFAQYQGISIDHRRDFNRKVDHFPLRIVGINITFTSAFRFQLTKLKYDITILIEKSLMSIFFFI